MANDLATRWGNSRLNFQRTIDNLTRSLGAPITEPRDLSGIIKDFELAYELSWKTLRLYLSSLGHQANSPRDVFRKAYQSKLISHESLWLRMIDDRNETVHTYNEEKAKTMVRNIRDYLPEFQTLISGLPSSLA